MILDLINRARRRLLWNTIAIQCANALNIAIATVLLLLIFGSGMVDWRWLVLFPILRLALGLWLACAKLPGAYSTAQRLDGTLRLRDALSTAVFFHSTSRRGIDGGMRDAQWQEASRLAAGIRAADVFPIRMPRAMYLSILLAAIAAGLFAWRYGFEERLDLRMPMAAMQQFLLEQQKALSKLELALKRDGGNPPDSEKEKSKNADASGKQGTEPAPLDADDRSSDVAESAEKQEKQPSQDQPDASEQTGEQRTASSRRPSDGDAASKQEQQTSGNQEAESGNPKSSVLSKITDTMANLLSAIKPRPGNNGAPQPGEMAQNQRSRETRQDGKSGGQEGHPQAQGSASRDGEGGEKSEQAGASRAAPQGSGSDSQSEMMQGTGAGRQDGDKQTNMAEQIAAMGKISVILGKRAEALSGTATVELQSGQNRLQTQYEQRSVEHAQASATSDRDEIPLALQEYVKEYFKQVNVAAKPAAARARK